MTTVAEFRTWKGPTAAFAAGLICAAWQAQALDLTIGGAFDDRDDVFLIEFSVAGSGPSVPVTLFTSNFDPTDELTTPIDPNLTLFSGTGSSALLEDENDDIGPFDIFSADVNGVIFTTGIFDSLLEVDLPAGVYTLGLSSFPNFAVGDLLGDGYERLDLGFGPDFDFGFETGNFRVHLLGVDEVLGTQGPAPVSPSFPRRDFIS